jgi:hypothetical protein
MIQHVTDIPQLYIKLKGWDPPPAPLLVENAITLFEKQLKLATHQNTLSLRNKTPNLTPIQLHTLSLLKKSMDFIIMPMDKNLGPAIMNWNEYIEQNLTEHLLTNNYRQLSTTEAEIKVQQTKQLLKDNYNLHKKSLSKSEQNFLDRSFKLQHCTPIFYGMPKVHKIQLTFRPVVSCINSFNFQHMAGL